MPRLVQLLIAGLALDLVVAGAAAAQDANARAVREAEAYLTTCTAAAPAVREECETNRRLFVDAYVKAKAGDYQGQRNAAWFLHRGDSPPMQRNPIQACAWRLVIVSAGHAQAGPGDTGNVRIECGRLSEAERAAAQARATQLLRQIATSWARMPAAAQRPSRPPCEANSTASPLTLEPPPPPRC
ncbi:MAG: hypothetical protein IRY92_05730 [Dactylosporangium sp.]|nr:hypothetical protein [Dactylosporangium sp.]